MSHRLLNLLALLGMLATSCSPMRKPAQPYRPAAFAITTHFPARTGPVRRLIIEAGTDISFMRPFLVDFQAIHPDVDIVYEDMQSNQVLERALDACRRSLGMPDIYLSVATDHLVRLANDGCGQRVSDKLAPAPDWREWRHEVFAFALEPAVFVYDRRRLADTDVPLSHLGLIDALRTKPSMWSNRIGTYDIEKTGIGYNYTEFDSHQSTLFGRLLESFGRSHVRLYCCSNEMVGAVQRGDILLAYNVQLSYAYAAQRGDANVGIVIPTDYQAIQTRSAMVSRDAVHAEEAMQFIDYLVSARAQAIESRLLQSPRPGESVRFSPTERLLNQANVSSALLRLQDQARRAELTLEWRQALQLLPS
jgi:iron(III) transport system substrate-binding protein